MVTSYMPAGAWLAWWAQELAYVDRCLEGDEKNYHAWSHRAAVAARWGLWQGELGMTKAMLARDVRNNSAWSHRFAAVSHLAQRRAHGCPCHASMPKQAHAGSRSSGEQEGNMPGDAKQGMAFFLLHVHNWLVPLAIVQQETSLTV